MPKLKRIMNDKIKNIVNECIKKVVNEQKYHILSEGVSYDKKNNIFTFNFEHDNDTDIIKLENIGYEVEQFERCYYYGYEFSPDVDAKVRKDFIKFIKFPESFEDRKDLQLFISKAVGYLDSKITLPKYNAIIYPQSMSELNRNMLSYISRITTTKYIEIELVKELPSKIEFDYERFELEVLNSYVNDKPRYTQAQKENVLKTISEMMESIHNSDYFSIARDTKKNRYRQYISNYYKFKDEKTKQIYNTLTNSNVLVIDDIVTNGTTIYHLLNTLRSLNDTNNIVIFSLLGKKF